VATVEDIRNRKRIRSEFVKRRMDIPGLDLQVLHGVVYLRGVVKTIKGGPTDLRAEVELVCGLVKQTGLAKDVVIDCQFRL
jgi:hypothetical protein